MKMKSFVLFIIICLVGCWTAPVPPAPIVQSIVSKPKAKPWPTFRSNRAATVQILYHLVDSTSGIYAGPYGGVGLIVGPNIVIDVGWHSTTMSRPMVLQGITVGSLSGDWFQPASIIGRFGGGTENEIAVLKTDEELPVKPVTFSRAFAGRKIKGYRFASDDSLEEFNLNKVASVFVTPSDNPQCDMVNRSNASNSFSYSDSTFDTDHNLVCYYDRPWWEVRAGLLRFGVVTITK